MNKTPISVVIITKNEQARIRPCLESVKWAGEIVVLDDHSRDRTVPIAKEYTDKIYQKEMTNEGAHRNYAYSLASNEWVLSLDADEQVTPELQEEISKVLAKGTDCNGFTVPRKNFIGDYWMKHGGWYPSAQLRLFRKDKFKYEEVDVHPRAFMKDPRGQLENPLLHYSYRDIEDFIDKLNNQTDRESKKWGELEKGMPFQRAMRRSIDRFVRAYYGKGGRKDGMYGFILASMGGFYQFLSYAKYWEKNFSEAGRHPSQDVARLVVEQNRQTTVEAKELIDLRGKIGEREISYNMKAGFVKLFWRFYVKKMGFREGMRGFVFSVLSTWAHFLKWAKYWEMTK